MEAAGNEGAEIEEALTHEMVWHCQQEGKEVVKRERTCMLKMHSQNWGHSSSVVTLVPLSLEIMNRRNIITSNAKLHQEAHN